MHITVYDGSTAHSIADVMVSSFVFLFHWSLPWRPVNLGPFFDTRVDGYQKMHPFFDARQLGCQKMHPSNSDRELGQWKPDFNQEHPECTSKILGGQNADARSKFFHSTPLLLDGFEGWKAERRSRGKKKRFRGERMEGRWDEVQGGWPSPYTRYRGMMVASVLNAV